MNKRYLVGLLVAFVSLDLALTFWHNYNLPLDGDLVAIVLPASWYTQVLHDPFGWSVLTQHATYGATNRFFVHAEMGLYWKTVPRLLHLLASPIASLYLASALFATLTQAALIFWLARYIQVGLRGTSNAASSQFWLLAALLAPLFQTAGGFYEQMGVTDQAITYTFFYAFAMLLVLALAWPFYQAICQQQPLQLPWWRVLPLLALMPVVAFGGPLGVATLLVLLVGVGIKWMWGLAEQWQRGGRISRGNNWLSTQAVLLLTVLLSLCVYSLYIGRSNSENTHSHTLADLYRLLPLGIARYVTYQWGIPLVLMLLVINFLLIRQVLPPSLMRQRALQLLGWIGLFVATYLLLLPFGGYRDYRPNLLRNDTALPVILSLLIAYGLSAYLLLANLRGWWRGSYTLVICAFGAFFFVQDNQSVSSDASNCQRWSLDQLARSWEPVVELSTECNVLTWGAVHDAHESELQGQMLHYWGVTPSKKLYYQK